jgi:hypothetical protein
MKRQSVSELPLEIIADIAEYAVMHGDCFNTILEYYYGRDPLSVMGYFLIQQSIRGFNGKYSGLESLP